MLENDIFETKEENILIDTEFFVGKIFSSKSILEAKESVISFLEFINRNILQKNQICSEFIANMCSFSFKYLDPYVVYSKQYMIIPPKEAPLFLLLNCLKSTKDVDLIIDSLGDFVNKCDEFVEPQQLAVTLNEIKLVLDVAQKKFKILDIIARMKPLKIVRFKNTHCIYNCLCGITANQTHNEAIINVYHSKKETVEDRVFIFAHELGHALHLALTNDVSIMPDKFDKFNEMLDMKKLSLHEKQECFADVVAMAVLNCDVLNKHQPPEISKEAFLHFETLISVITRDFIEPKNKTIF